MDFYNEKLLRREEPVVRYDPILLEPPPAIPPAEAAKPVTSQDTDLDCVEFSLRSDASEYDRVDLPNGGQNEVVTRNNPPFSSFNSQPTPYVSPVNKQLIKEIHELASVKSYINTASPLLRNQANISFECSNGASNHILDNKNGKYIRTFVSDYQNVNGAKSSFERVKNAYEPQDLVNISNQSDSVSLQPQQLKFQESITAMHQCVSPYDVPHLQHLSKNDSSQFDLDNINKFSTEHNNSFGGRDVLAINQYQPKLHPGISNKTSSSQGSCLNSHILNTGEVSSNEMWTLFEKQNEKIKQLENQLAAIQQQNSTGAVTKRETSTPLSEDIKLDIINLNIKSTILECMTGHNNTVLELKDQVSILAKRIEELESGNKGKISERLEISNNGVNNTSNKSDYKNDVTCETRVESTLASFRLDGNERKLLLERKTTVLTENSIRCSSNKDPVQLNKSGNSSSDSAPECTCRKCSKGEPPAQPKRTSKGSSSHCPSPKSLDSKKQRKSKGELENNRDHQNIVPKTIMDSPDIPLVKQRARNRKKPSPLPHTNQENRGKESTKPTLSCIQKNVDLLLMQDYEDEEYSEKYGSDSHASSDRRKSRTSNRKISRPLSGNNQDNRGTTVRRNIDHFVSTDDENGDIFPSKYVKRKSWKQKKSNTTSNTSEDSDCSSPKSRSKDDRPIKKYGLHPTQMSYDTQQYLKEHRLFHH